MRERVEQGLFLEGGEAGAEEGSFRLLAEKDTVELAMEKIFYLGMMIAAGLLFGLQSPINAQLSRSVGVLEGSFLSFLGGTLVLGLAMLVFGKGHVGGVFGVPAWQLVGGLCELSRNLRISVTRNENVPRHFFALARFLSAFGKGAAACQN